MFNYNHLYYFYITAKMGGVMNASKTLRIAQPSLSAQIKTLERELNLSLFHKVGRRIALTPDGERAYGFCRKIFEAADEFSDYLKHSGTSRSHRARIGVTHEIERPFIADVLSSVLRNKSLQEQPLISMISNPHSLLVESLKNGELDAIVSNQPAYGSDFNTIAELSMPVIAVATPSLVKKMEMKRRESLSKLLKEKEVGLILPSEKLKIRIETDLFLQRHKIRNPAIFESDILAVVVRAALDGIGIAFLPKHYIAKELNYERLISLGDNASLWNHSIYIITRNLKTPDPIVNQIRDHLVYLGAKALKL